MARRRRAWHPEGYYHITVRGNNRQNIFLGQADVCEYFRILHYVYEKYNITLYAYCLMTNHTHLLLRSPDVPLGKIMAILNKRYSDYFRVKYEYTGQIYENRYFSKEAYGPESLLNTGAYIHRNPIETKTPMVQTMEDYPFSSYRFYYYNLRSPFPFLNLKLLPSLLPTDKGKNVKTAYASYCEKYNPD